MRKATASKEKPQRSQSAAPTAPSNLGTKRACPKCSAKFYDFGKEELPCPKCHAKLKVSELKPSFFTPPPEPKKVKAVEKVAPEAILASDESDAPGTDDTFESIDDLADSEEDIEVEVEDKDDNY